MTYDEFKEEFLSLIDDKLEGYKDPIDYTLLERGMEPNETASLERIRETNRKFFGKDYDKLLGDFLVVFNKETSMASRIALTYLHECYEQKGWDFVWKIIFKEMDHSHAKDIQYITEHIYDYDTIKNRLIIRPLNYSDNSFELREAVYERIGDMALVLYIYIGESKEKGIMSTKATRSNLNTWGVTKDEVMEEAIENSFLRAVPRMYDLDTVTFGQQDYSVGAYMSIGAKFELSPTSVFTTYPAASGARSFWYPGVKEKLAEMAGGDYYVSFTSVDDFHIHPIGSMSPRSILQILKDFNKNMNKRNEILTRKLYIYKAKTGKLEEMVL